MKSLLARHPEQVALAALAVLVVVVTVPTPVGIYAIGLVGGAALALQAAGLVLVYRASKVINFAQLQLGALGAGLFVGLVDRRSFISGLRAVCPPCVPVPASLSAADVERLSPQLAELARTSPRQPGGLPEGIDRGRLAVELAPSWMTQANYWLSMLVAIFCSVALVWLVYTLVVKRFNQAPRLVLTIVTIGVGHVILGLGGWILDRLFSSGPDTVPLSSLTAPVPIDLRVELAPAVFGVSDVLIVATAIVASGGLAFFLRRTATGVALRAVSENGSRAQTLGVNVGTVTGRAWMLAGLLSGVAAVLTATKLGPAETESLDLLVRALAAAVVGGFFSLPLSMAGALVLGLLDQSMLWKTESDALVALALLVVIVALLLAQRRRVERADVDSRGTWSASREIRPIPKELREVPAVRNTVRALVAVGVMVLLGYPWVMSPSQTNQGTVTLTYVVIGMSLLVLTGWAGQISLGQMAFAAVGAWVAGMLGLPLPLALVAGATAGAALALVVGLSALRLRGLHLAISTLALALVASSVLLSPKYLGSGLPDSLQRPMFLGIDFNDERAFYYLTLVLTAAVIAGVMGLRRSRVARALIAAKDNESAAQLFGINLLRTRVGAFVVSGALAAVGGVMFAYSQRAIEPESFDAATSVNIFLVTIVGGLGSIAGPVLGAFYFGLLDVASSTALGPLATVLASPGLGVLLVLVFMPGGLTQGVFGMRDAWLRRVAARRHIDVPSLVADRGSVVDVAPIAPRVSSRGTAVVVPVRYRLAGQWRISPWPEPRPDRHAEPADVKVAP